jgi:hypothetical protein
MSLIGFDHKNVKKTKRRKKHGKNNIKTIIHDNSETIIKNKEESDKLLVMANYLIEFICTPFRQSVANRLKNINRKIYPKRFDVKKYIKLVNEKNNLLTEWRQYIISRKEKEGFTDQRIQEAILSISSHFEKSDRQQYERIRQRQGSERLQICFDIIAANILAILNIMMPISTTYASNITLLIIDYLSPPFSIPENNIYKYEHNNFDYCYFCGGYVIVDLVELQRIESEDTLKINNSIIKLYKTHKCTQKYCLEFNTKLKQYDDKISIIETCLNEEYEKYLYKQ